MIKSAASPQFTIIIPAWNEAACIEQTLSAINTACREVHSDLQFDGEVIVVDNNSTDQTAEIARANGANVVFEPVNQIAKARNTGARSARGQWLLFVDADTIISTDLLGAALSRLAGGETVAGGATVAFDQKLTGFAAGLVRFWNWWSVRSRTAAGCFIFCSKDAFDAVGGFDERQFVAEELYLSKGLRKYAKANGQRFSIISDYPVLSSARKKDWYSTRRIAWQIFLLLIPGASRSRRLCGVWYDRSHLS